MGAFKHIDVTQAQPVRLRQPFGVRIKLGRPAPFDPLAPVLGRLCELEVRLARSRAELREAQQLRYNVFYEEMSAKPTAFQRMTRRDRDGFDKFCDHLLVIDTTRPAGSRIVGTYRLLRQEKAALAGGFYTAGEFEIDALVGRHPGARFLELGRSCVLKSYRGKRTVELLWQGIWAYVKQHRIDVLFGCASLSGTDLAALEAPLAFLRDHAPAPEEWRVAAVSGRRARVGSTVACLDAKRALGGLPPLLKGYLRLGGYVGEDAVVDHQFGTTDVCVVVPVKNINPRYIQHFGAEGTRFAA
ncbi:GNAT family N-acetyltransferase [Aureimonas sp. AU20]|uniref:GNAT family N-acetyltransferase n=1 Tax=Aureimonas sp. AU20 TaxID=1349819 RepID=UPI0007213C86|nr:GNAT family N-acyltransferase [Aureimonas sp. AU20]ALN71290.1 hypothetical protein M673_01110 [Aureimonas sp. AU20]